jgi:hypothetical protein
MNDESVDRHIQRWIKDASWIAGLPCVSLTSRTGDGNLLACPDGCRLNVQDNSLLNAFPFSYHVKNFGDAVTDGIWYRIFSAC